MYQGIIDNAPPKFSLVGYKCLAKTPAWFSTRHTITATPHRQAFLCRQEPNTHTLVRSDPPLANSSFPSSKTAMNHLSQEHPQAWPWGMAMYTNLHYHHYYEKEHLFEKPLTPSDVGKLNRLVIPKQHAERYFPLSGDSGEKGLILSFEDEAGKPWQFRYSYWTSSQSYVLTKGWSRYVKEKQLDAGDVVHFERMRGFGMADRLFICYRRRGESATAAPAPPPPTVRVAAPSQSAGREQQQPWSPMCYSTSGSYPTSPANSHAYRCSVDHDHSNMQHAGESPWDRDNRSSASAPSRQLRLFGVNLDCGPGPEPEPETPTTMYSYMHQSPYAPDNSGSP